MARETPLSSTKYPYAGKHTGAHTHTPVLLFVLSYISPGRSATLVVRTRVRFYIPNRGYSSVRLLDYSQNFLTTGCARTTYFSTPLVATTAGFDPGPSVKHERGIQYGLIAPMDKR